MTSCLREKEQVKPSNPLRPRQSKVTIPERKVQENVKTQEHKPLNTGGLEWMNMDQLAKIPLSGSKYYLIDVYTEWCGWCKICLLYTSPSPRDLSTSRMPSSA